MEGTGRNRNACRMPQSGGEVTISKGRGLDAIHRIKAIVETSRQGNTGYCTLFCHHKYRLEESSRELLRRRCTQLDLTSVNRAVTARKQISDSARLPAGAAAQGFWATACRDHRHDSPVCRRTADLFSRLQQETTGVSTLLAMPCLFRRIEDWFRSGDQAWRVTEGR